MWNYAFLVAKQHELNKLLEKDISLEFNPEIGLLLYSINGTPYSFNLNEGLEKKELLFINNRYRFQKDISSLLHYPVRPPLPFERCTLEYLLEKDIKQNVKSHMLKKGIVSYSYKGKLKKLKIEGNESYKEINLICSEFLKEGGQIEEVLGKFFRLRTLGQQLPIVTTTSHCSCDEYEAYTSCYHLKMVKYIINNRDLFPSLS